MSNDYEVIYQYTRKSYKQNPRDTVFENCPVDTIENSNEIGTCELEGTQIRPRHDDYEDSPPHQRELFDPDVEFDVLHKKCPVIYLAQQQLSRLLHETNRFSRSTAGPYSSRYRRLLCCCVETILWADKSRWALLALSFVAFCLGLLFGAATCGTHFGKFNNPILNCIDNYFIPDSHINVEDTFHSIT